MSQKIKNKLRNAFIEAVQFCTAKGIDPILQEVMEEIPNCSKILTDNLRGNSKYVKLELCFKYLKEEENAIYN